MQAMVAEQCGLLSQFLPRNERFGAHSEANAEANPAAYRVLILEPSAPLAKLLATGLAAERLQVEVTHHLGTAMQHLEARNYDLVILGLDGTQNEGAMELQNLRFRNPAMQVLVLGGQSGVEGLVKALDEGADDYLFKPFSLLELMARVRALRRRSRDNSAAPTARANKLVLHRDQCRVERDGRSIDLTPREFALLEVLMENPGRTLSRSMLTQKVWNMAAEANTNIVDVYIKYLRDKIDGEHEEKLIRTVRGMGYVMQVQ
jgi:two-component system copper resistance phosphate regulon response regulator CusR